MPHSAPGPEEFPGVLGLTSLLDRAYQIGTRAGS